jgi:hypothetical protein
MISGKSIKNTYGYLAFYIGKILYKHGSMNLKSLLKEIKKNTSIKRNSLIEIVKNNFDYNSYSKITSLHDKTVKIYKCLDNLSFSNNKSTDYFISKFINLNNLAFRDYENILLYDYLSYLYRDIYDREIINFFFFFTNFHKDDNYYKVEKAVLAIKDCEDKKPISTIIDYDDVITMLNHINVFTMQNLRQTSISLLLILYNYRIDNLIWKLTSKQKDLLSDINETISLLENQITEDDYQILSLRQGIEGDKHTLEKLGNIYNLTRERIRQKEANIKRKVKLFSSRYRDLINSFAYYLFDYYESSIIDYKMINNYIGEHYIWYILLVNSFEANHITCDDKRQVMFLGDKDKLVQEEKNIIKGLPIVIKKIEINSYVEKHFPRAKKYITNLFQSNYKPIDNLMIKSGYRYSDMILQAIDQLFPKGYRISSRNHIEKLRKYFKDNYGQKHANLGQRKIESAIHNHDYRLCDRGTYINKKFLPILDEDLINNIIDFIDKKDYNVYYDTLYKEFKSELDANEVENKYMLKGIIDPVLNNYFYTKRDYISKHPNSKANSPIYKYIEQAEGMFTYDDIAKKFKGVADYVIFHALYNYTDDTLIWLSDKRYIKLPDLEMDNQLTDLFIEECEYQFTTLNINHISSRKIYARLRINHRQIMDKSNIIKNHYDLYSIMKHLLSERFFFHRSYISRVDESIDHSLIVRKFVLKHDWIDKERIDDFLLKMNMRSLYSYLEFIDDYSDKYVQVSQDKIVKKEILQINDDLISDIDDSIMLILNNSTSINTETFRGYYIFPKFNYNWNKYLLAGVVRTFLSDKYLVENTSNSYNKTDFIIRRI